MDTVRGPGKTKAIILMREFSSAWLNPSHFNGHANASDNKSVRVVLMSSARAGVVVNTSNSNNLSGMFFFQILFCFALLCFCFVLMRLF